MKKLSFICCIATIFCLFISCSQDTESENYNYCYEDTILTNIFNEIHKKNPTITKFIHSEKAPENDFSIYSCPVSRVEGKYHSPFSTDVLFWVEDEILYYYGKGKIKFNQDYCWSNDAIITFYEIDSTLEYIDLSGFDLSIDVEKMYVPGKSSFKYSAVSFGGCSALKSINFGKNKNIFVNCKGLFGSCSSLEEIDLSIFDTAFDKEYFSSMDGMFAGCKSLKKIDMTPFDTGNVSSMKNMFNGCISLEEIIFSKFDTGKCLDMTGMFANCTNFKKIDLSSFDTGSVTSMANMFYGCTSLEEINLSSFNTGKCQNMAGMFEGCTSLDTVDVSNFDTSNVKGDSRTSGFSNMFKDCTSLKELDVTSFVVQLNSWCYKMFENCTSLTTIYAKPGTDWDGYNYETKSYSIHNSDIFENCISLVGGKGTAYANDGIVTGRTRIDGLDDGRGFTRGYFTEKK